jgi:CubicO group peptidase (beta-lactamase class C family)
MRKFAALIILIAVSCTSKVEESTSSLDILDKKFSAFFPEGEPGGAVLLAKDGEIIFSKGYGIADINTKESITAKTLFNLGSISKTFVSNAILVLEEQGKLSIDDELIKYFPEFKNPEIGSKVRIKHLLTHTSGLPDNRKVNEDTVFYLTAKDAENWAPELEVDSLNFEPGTNFEYSNPAFNGLALIIEQVSGIKWQDFIIENIMRPSGMVASTITDGAHPESGVSHGYEKYLGKFIEDDYGEEPTFAAAGNGGVWSSVEELFQYELALESSKFLSKEKMQDSRIAKKFRKWIGEEPENIGWSWFVTKTEEGLPMVGHTGSQGGFRANYQTIPEKEIFFVILCNTPRDGFSEIMMGWLRENNWLDGMPEKN